MKDKIMFLRAFSSVLLVASMAPAVCLAAPVTDAEAVAMVEKAVAFAKASGDRKLIDRVNAQDKEFVKGESYIVVRDTNGTILAHGTKSSLVGKNLNDVPDADGKMFRQEITDGASKNGKGWVKYKSKNPASGQMEAKKTYFQKSGTIIVESGIYDKQR